ncbi:STAS domain-containing protein [uncultured Phycicoccus sp.]|uniref:STAS domain-containing protein n=1 Tax=uncultured Phycicoccus sp. TaxID=661422 RepID=UPI002610A586|nr:STAS domain-containing protein [uncultured Phycicoccus sp.]
MAQHHAPLVSMSEHIRDDGVLVRVGGRLDRRTAADVRTAMHRLLSGPGPAVLLDLDEAVIGDATALGLLVELRRLAQRSGVELRVVAADDRTARLLCRVRLHALLTPPLRTTAVVGPTLAQVV